jgi:hypothetical protein
VAKAQPTEVEHPIKGTGQVIGGPRSRVVRKLKATFYRVRFGRVGYDGIRRGGGKVWVDANDVTLIY